MRLKFWLLLIVFCGFSVLVQAQSDVTIHVVQRGENLYRIAMRYGMTVEELSRLNGIVNPGSIQVGQRLLVAPQSPSVQEIHTVRPGETLTSIALLYGLTADHIVSINTIPDSGNLYVGQILNITPVSAPDETTAAEAVQSVDSSSFVSAVHVVQRGETLFRIAQNYGVTVNELIRINSLTDPSLIYVGQQLIITGAQEPLSLDLPEPLTRFDITPQTPAEGKTVHIRLTTSRPVRISGTFLNRVLGVISSDNYTTHTVIQGIPLFTEPGIYTLELLLVDVEGQNQTAFATDLQISAGSYGRESINLLAGRDGLLDTNVEQAEMNLLQAVMTTVTETRYFDGPMSLPAAATIISPFGTRRSYNGSAFDRFHSGTDFAGAPGTPVLAAAAGRVVLVDTLNVRGQATVIDHGWGVFTGYWHQSQQYVGLGDFVAAGQTIGTIGSTGRVTGAHLHWELWAGGVPVDPMQWVRQSFN